MHHTALCVGVICSINPLRVVSQYLILYVSNVRDRRQLDLISCDTFTNKPVSPTAPSGNLNLLISSRNSFEAYRAFSHSSTSALALQLLRNVSRGDPLVDRDMLIRVQLMPSLDLT